jgi:L-threonylcarbamoyladenylate synthase
MDSPKDTVLLKVDPERPDKERIAYCAALIRNGALVVFPTETVYGIAANLLDAKATRRLYRIKHRPRTKPFTVHIADIASVKKMGCRLDRKAALLARRFWPGPLTMILKSGAGRKIGFRMPANKVALRLIKKAKVPVVAPSANLSGSPPPRSASDVLDQLGGKIDAVLDAGPTEIGTESTVVDMTSDPPKILREGAISRKEIIETLNSKP